MEHDLPYRSIEHYPARYDAAGILIRLVDGLGFRYYWATEGLREEDLPYTAGNNGQTIRQLLDHVCRLVDWVYASVTGNSHDRPDTFEDMRRQTLSNLAGTSSALARMKGTDIGTITLSGNPAWHMVNGPLSDALSHVGQITMLRRAAGNPVARGISVFDGKPPSEDI